MRTTNKKPLFESSEMSVLNHINPLKKSDILIRPMEEKDIDDILDMFDVLSDKDKEFLVWEYKADDIIKEIENLDNCYVAEVDGVAVALLIRLDWKLGYSLLDTLVVHPDYRDMGIGTKMMDFYHEKFPYSTAKTNIDNFVMHELLKKYGYGPFQWMREENE